MMSPGPIFEGLKVCHAQFGFCVLQTAFDKIALTFTVGQAGERRWWRGIGQTIANGLSFALEQQSFLTNRASTVDGPDGVAGKLDLHLATFGGAQDDFFPDSLRQAGIISRLECHLFNDRELFAGLAALALFKDKHGSLPI